MKLEEQVCSLELTKKLKELGVKQESLWSWAIGKEDGLTVVIETPEDNTCLHLENPTNGKHYIQDIKECYSAFTVAELGMMLPDNVKSLRLRNKWICEADVDEYSGESKVHVTEANARAKMLIYMIENKLMEVK